MTRRAVRGILKPVRLRQNWYEFWKPRNKVRAVRRDWPRTASISAVLIGLLLLIQASAGDSDALLSSLSSLPPAASTPLELPGGDSVAVPPPVADSPTPEVAPAPSVQSGILDDSDPRLDDGRIYEARTLRLQEGRGIVVTMQSGDFDTFITLGELRSGSFISLATNDDAGRDSTNSRLEFVPPASGEYIVLFSSYEAGRTGNYTYALE